MLGIDEKIVSPPPKKQILMVVLQNYKKSAVKYFIEKHMLLNFVGWDKLRRNESIHIKPFLSGFM